MTVKNEPLNYSLHAIEAIQDYYDKNPLLIQTFTGITLDIIKRMLQESVKFILPNKGEILISEGEGSITQEHMDMVRLPFPITAFEVPYYADEEVTQYDGFAEQIKSNRRIGLCWDLQSKHPLVQELIESVLVKSMPPRILEETINTEGFCMLSIYEFSDHKVWDTNMGAVFVPYNHSIEDAANNVTESSREMTETLVKDGSNRVAGFINLSPIPIFPEKMEYVAKESYGNNMEQVFNQIVLDANTELSAVIQACCTLNCSNISTQDIEPPKKLNAKRIAKGKLPFFTYKVLEIKEKNNKKEGAENGGGQHSSPRTHMRRGHLRRYSEDHVIYVRSAIINAHTNKGIVIKDYKV